MPPGKGKIVARQIHRARPRVTRFGWRVDLLTPFGIYLDHVVAPTQKLAMALAADIARKLLTRHLTGSQPKADGQRIVTNGARVFNGIPPASWPADADDDYSAAPTAWSSRNPFQ
jgi:hypothetical protein